MDGSSLDLRFVTPASATALSPCRDVRDARRAAHEGRAAEAAAKFESLLATQLVKAHCHGRGRSNQVRTHFRRRTPASRLRARRSEQRPERGEHARWQHCLEVLKGSATYVRIVGREGAGRDPHWFAFEGQREKIEDVLPHEVRITAACKLPLDE